MSTPMEYYNSLPPVAKTYAVICFMTAAAYQLELYDVWNIALFYSDVFRRFQVWRLVTNFFFIGAFSFTFAFRLLIILRYGVQLERGPFDKRTADYVWMFLFGAIGLLVMSIFPFLWSPFMGASLVFMIVYIWGREFPNERINVYGLVQFKGFYLPWYMLGIDMILGNPLKPDMLGIAAGHIYYFLTVLHPLATGKNYFNTPRWVHKLVAYWGKGFQVNSPFRSDPSAGTAFRGRGRRLNGSRSSSSSRDQTTTTSEQAEETPTDSNSNEGGGRGGGVAFRGRSYRLGGR
ncbi:PREDICTED: derlin-1-like [Ipomoea nil]|uniref:derlin-1-like n=1 Tax=Ipomoea nil TaxID=35883 RepID=UPI00090197AD|nr:PREDICTED: derlin-1-like [Ipomoea nil]